MTAARRPEPPPLPGFTEEPTVTSVRELSCVRLRGANRRTIALLSRPGDRPCIAIVIWEGRRPTTRIFIHAPAVAPVLAAIEVLRDPAFRGGVKPCGAIALRDGGRIEVAAQRPIEKAPAVLFTHVGPDGSQLGRGMNIFGPELDALARACAELQQMTRA